MLDCLPDRQKPKAEGEPGSHRGYLDIRRGRHRPLPNKTENRSEAQIKDQTTKETRRNETHRAGGFVQYMYRGCR